MRLASHRSDCDFPTLNVIVQALRKEGVGQRALDAIQNDDGDDVDESNADWLVDLDRDVQLQEMNQA